MGKTNKLTKKQVERKYNILLVRGCMRSNGNYDTRCWAVIDGSQRKYAGKTLADVAANYLTSDELALGFIELTGWSLERGSV